MTVGLLDRFQVAGVIASWWGDIQFDLRALAAGGFGAVIDGWVTTITTALDDKTVKGTPLDHRFVRVLLPEYLDEIDEALTYWAELDARIKRAGGSGDDEAEDQTDEEDALSPAELAALKKDLAAAKRGGEEPRTKVCSQALGSAQPALGQRGKDARSPHSARWPHRPPRRLRCQAPAPRRIGPGALVGQLRNQPEEG